MNINLNYDFLFFVICSSHSDSKVREKHKDVNLKEIMIIYNGIIDPL